jgi:hypothetical protein
MLDQVRGRRFTIPPAAAANPVRQRSDNALRDILLIAIVKSDHFGRYLQRDLQMYCFAKISKAPATIAGALIFEGSLD